jgi:hypothetical protein
MPVLTVGDLRRLLADDSIPDDMLVVSWSTDSHNQIDGVKAVGVISETRRMEPGLFIGEDAITCTLAEPEFERRLWGADDNDEPET